MKERKRDSSFIRFSLTSVGTHFPRPRPLKRNITSFYVTFYWEAI